MKLLDPFFCTYFCKDNKPFYMVVPSHSRHQKRAMEALGLDINLL